MSEELLNKKVCDENNGSPVIFGIRHLSPAGAWHLRKLLDRVKPELVLIEGPSDFNQELSHIADKAVKPPIAIMAYTAETPIHTILYPFSVYSPEYQAILWAAENKTECRFIDLPSGTFLALSKLKEAERLERERKRYEADEADDGEAEDENSVEETGDDFDIYAELDRVSGEDNHETFWEHNLEHFTQEDAYHEGAVLFGNSIRKLSYEDAFSHAENLVREAYMKRQIDDAVKSGISPDKIVVVTGAYHTEGLKGEVTAMTDSELAKLPAVKSDKTLMPYSYYRLSTRSGYGAGNKAPAYYELLWKGFLKGEADYAARSYLAKIAAWQRANGNMVSSAEVIEAMQLAFSLAGLHGYKIPSLKDLKDAAITCMGHGNFSEIVNAVADTEIGTAIGSLPKGVSNTSIQNDFYGILDELNLRKYCTATAEELKLDLREKLTVKSEKAAFADLERSFFLHRLNVLGISFVKYQRSAQDNATWAESWVLKWSPEAEIELVEAQLKGDTVLQAASFHMKEQLENNPGIAAAARIIEQSFLCGMPETAGYAVSVLQGAATDAAAIEEIADTISSLSIVVQYGNIRKISSEPLIPVLEQLYFRACLLLPESCICDDNAAKTMAHSIGQINEAVLNHDFLPDAEWIKVMSDIALRDDLNTKLSGYATAILLERGKMANEELEIQVSRRLSAGVPADLGAGWFEGLSMKNRYALITRLGLWKTLDIYLDTLDEEEFKRALLFLRRAFADFTAKEKSDIAENLGELWNLNPVQTDVILNTPLSEEAQEMLEGLDDFDFGDI